MAVTPWPRLPSPLAPGGFLPRFPALRLWPSVFYCKRGRRAVQRPDRPDKKPYLGEEEEAAGGKRNPRAVKTSRRLPPAAAGRNASGAEPEAGGPRRLLRGRGAGGARPARRLAPRGPFAG